MPPCRSLLLSHHLPGPVSHPAFALLLSGQAGCMDPCHQAGCRTTATTLVAFPGVIPGSLSWTLGATWFMYFMVDPQNKEWVASTAAASPVPRLSRETQAGPRGPSKLLLNYQWGDKHCQSQAQQEWQWRSSWDLLLRAQAM